MAQLPTARIKTIMKSTAEVDTVNKEAVYTLTRATVCFPLHFLLDVLFSPLFIVDRNYLLKCLPVKLTRIAEIRRN